MFVIVHYLVNRSAITPPPPHPTPINPADKPRVYQGVRVKTTVKELLQRHRAREANRKKVKTVIPLSAHISHATVLPVN